MLTKARFASRVGFAEFGHVALLQAFVACACTEASFPFFLRRRFFKHIAIRQAMSRAAERTAIRRRRRSAALTRRRSRRGDFGAGELRIRLGSADGAAHRTHVPFRKRTFIINEIEKLFKRQFNLVQRKVLNRFFAPFIC